MEYDSACRICRCDKRITMTKPGKLVNGNLGLPTTFTGPSTVTGLYTYDKHEYESQGYVVTEVFCSNCGIMYHPDTV